MRSSSEWARETPTIDMTPMIDVVFLLIVFFLCVDFRVLESKLPAYLPSALGERQDSKEPRAQLPIRIVCEQWGTAVPRDPQAEARTENGRRIEPSIRLEGHRVHYLVGPKRVPDLLALRAELQAALGKTPGVEGGKQPVVIEPGPDTTYSDVTAVVDAVTAAGFHEITFERARR
jgi:biopolymer transport protein ExbD